MLTISEINLKQKLLESNYTKDNEYLSKTNPVTGRSLYITESEIEEYESLGYIKYKRAKRV